MAEIFDFKLHSDFDLEIVDGDFVIAESTEQNQQLLLLAEKGSFVINPLSGVGIQRWINDEGGKDELKHAITSEIESDGMKIQKLDVNTLETIYLEAGYE